MRVQGPSRIVMAVAGTGAVLGLPVYRSYRRALAAARERVRTGSQLIRTACGPIEYATAGEGPDVLVIHGSGGGYDQGLDLAGSFGEGYRYIAPSRFGYLRTTLPADGRPPAQAEAHACLLDALGVDRVAVIADSAGAFSAVEFAARYPERTGLLLLLAPDAWVPPESATAAPPDPIRSAVEQFMLRVVLRSDFAFWAMMKAAPGTLEYFVGLPPGLEAELSPADRETVARIVANVMPISMRQAGLLNEAANARNPARAQLEHISAPTLVISAADDPFKTLPKARYTAEHISGARLIALERGGHLFVGPGRWIWGEANAFLRAHWPAQPGFDRVAAGIDLSIEMTSSGGTQ